VRVASKAIYRAQGIVDDRRRCHLLAAALTLVMLCPPLRAAQAGACEPRHPLPPVSLKDMGPCGFDIQTMSFAGDAKTQAMCLMRSLDRTRNLGPMLGSLPDAIASRVGTQTGLPTRPVLSGYLSAQNIEPDIAASVWQPLSRADDNEPVAPTARYFVIHDTSGPNFGGRAFPDDLDDNPRINNLAQFRCSDGWERAHVFINREGGILLGHDYGTAWRATKFERAQEFDGALKGLFVHNELIQPRRTDRELGRRNDAQSPNPAFTGAQYDTLALLYILASVRADHWLIPAFHAAIDADIPGGHDDPLNFDIEAFANAIDAVMNQMRNPASRQALQGP
jgi:hypothetical protein